MSQILSLLHGSVVLPALFAPTADASKRFIEFFTANIRNPNTRKAICLGCKRICDLVRS